MSSEDKGKYKVSSRDLPLSLVLVVVGIVPVVVFGWNRWTGILLAVVGGVGLGLVYSLLYNKVVGQKK